MLLCSRPVFAPPLEQNPDLVVGASFDNDGGTYCGAVFVLFLDVDGTVKAEQKISSTQGALTGPLEVTDFFGFSVANLGDVDGDSITDIAVGADGDDDGGSNRGAVYVLFMNADGTVKAEQKISSTQGGLTGPLEFGDKFGYAVASMGDLNADGVPGAYRGAPHGLWSPPLMPHVTHRVNDRSGGRCAL
jgi:hypothetical protein